MQARSFFTSMAFVAGLLPFSSLPAFSQLAMDSFKVPSSFDWDYYVLKDDGSSFQGEPWEIGVYDSTSNEYRTIVKCKDSGCNNSDMELGGIDPKTGKMIFADDGEGILYGYDPVSGAVSSVKDPFSESDGSLVRPSITGLDEVRIGKNSLITKENNGKQELYAEDVNGSAIPINITNGTDLQVDGVSVMGEINQSKKAITKNADDIDVNRQNIEANRQNINDLGSGVAGATALAAALSSLPVAADDAPFSCGVGTGGYSSRFAMGIGCAARLNERLSFNVGGSHVFGGSSSYGSGSLDTVAARAGFVFKLGTIHKSATSNEEQLQSQLDEVKQENASIRKENQDLMARLDRLEAIALGKQATSSTASLK